MKLITRDTDYAIRALIYIASSKKDVITAGEIEKKLKLPRPFLRKILQTLQKEGVLLSKKGHKGGFLLASSAHQIYLSDLIRIFQGEVTLIECLLKKKVCPHIKKCSVRKRVKMIEKKVVFELSRISIASLLGCR